MRSSQRTHLDMASGFRHRDSELFVLRLSICDERTPGHDHCNCWRPLGMLPARMAGQLCQDCAKHSRPAGQYALLLTRIHAIACAEEITGVMAYTLLYRGIQQTPLPG